MGFLPRFQQKQYRGRRAACAIGRLDPPGLAIPAAFRMGLQVQPADQLRCLAHRRQHCCRSEEHTSELQSLMRISYAVFCLKKKKKNRTEINSINNITQKL